MKNYIPLLGAFIAEYPIKKHFWLFYFYHTLIVPIFIWFLTYIIYYQSSC
jgi:hypothetical protein